jgi:hypothetical protein
VRQLRLPDKLLITAILSLIALMAVPSIWLIDTLFGLFSGDAAAIRYDQAAVRLLIGFAGVLPVTIAVGLAADSLRYFFPTLFDTNDKRDVSPSRRVERASDDRGGDG